MLYRTHLRSFYARAPQSHTFTFRPEITHRPAMLEAPDSSRRKEAKCDDEGRQMTATRTKRSRPRARFIDLTEAGTVSAIRFAYLNGELTQKSSQGKEKHRAVDALLAFWKLLRSGYSRELPKWCKRQCEHL
jgi:hypothetical protein